MLMSSQNSEEPFVKHSNACLQQASITTMKPIYLMTLVSNDGSSKEWSNTQKGWLMPPRVWLPLCTVPQQWVTYCPHILCAKLKVFGIAGFLEVLMVSGITGPRKAGLMQHASVIGLRVTFCQMYAIYLDLSFSSVITYRVTSATMPLYSQKSNI